MRSTFHLNALVAALGLSAAAEIEAVSKQLGLKLELEKRPFPVMVIDSMEEKLVEE